MNIPQNIFKSYDIRGVYPDEINEENIIPIIKAAYKFFQNEKKTTDSLTIVIGRDMRLSSPKLFEVAKNTLLDLGATVVDIGLSSTPTVYFATFFYKYDAGIQISASHNPKEYNGLKLVKRDEKGLVKIGKSTGMEEIKKMAIQAMGATQQKKGAVIEKTGVLEDEVSNALKIFDNPQVNKFKIVADAANAMGGLFIESLFKKIPGDLVKMNFELDGSFPAHQPDPLQFETLVDLQKKVVSEKADLGLAPDGDGDRLFFIDEKGNIVPPSIITGIVASEMLKKNNGANIMFDIRYILTPKKIVEENGGSSVIVRVGHAFITEKMHETDTIFAGESSGHYFFKATGNAESQLPIILTVLKVLTDEGKQLSEIVEEYRRSFESGEINFKVQNAQEIMQKLKNKYNEGELSELDGVAISYPDWRFSLRSSNTEPLLRLNIEAYDKLVMEQKKKEIVEIIKSIAS